MGYWDQKVVVVTGASSGLGKAIAAEYCSRGAQVVMTARGQEALDAAALQVARSGQPTPAVITADVTRDESVESLFAKIQERFGRLDALVNNAGRSSRRAIADATPADFAELMELNLLAPVRCTRAALGMLLKTRGHLVNIGSLAGRLGARYVGPYAASKFALSAYSQQLRLELGEQGLHVLLVLPGPIARDEARGGTVANTPPEVLAGLPPEASKPGAGAKTRPIRPERLARDIVTACERRQLELVVPAGARFLFAAGAISPRLGDWALRKFT